MHDKTADIIAREYHDLGERLGAGRTLEEAVAFLLLLGKRQPVEQNVAQMVEELLASLTTLKRSTRYIEDMRSRLRRFADDFPRGIGTVRRKEIADWLDSQEAARLPSAPRLSRNQVSINRSSW